MKILDTQQEMAPEWPYREADKSFAAIQKHFLYYVKNLSRNKEISYFVCNLFRERYEQLTGSQAGERLSCDIGAALGAGADDVIRAVLLGSPIPENPLDRDARQQKLIQEYERIVELLPIHVRSINGAMDSMLRLLNVYGEMEKLVHVLKERVHQAQLTIRRLEKQSGAAEWPADVILPGSCLQNDIRVDWSLLREEYKIVLDKPLEWYHLGLREILNMDIVNEQGEFLCTIEECINTGREDFQEKHSLGKKQVQEIEIALAQRGLCFDADPALVKRYFYFSYFAARDLKDMNLPAKAFVSLERKGIHTVGELMVRSRDMLSGLPYFGGVSLQTAEVLLNAMGFSLGMEVDAVRRLYFIE